MFEWDEEKNKSNLAKHGVSFEDCIPVFSDEDSLVLEDDRHYEQRWKVIGAGKFLVVLVVVYTYRNKIRIISARKATKGERKVYEQQRR